MENENKNLSMKNFSMKFNTKQIWMNFDEFAFVVQYLPHVIDTIVWHFLVVCEKCSINLATEICPNCDNLVYCQRCAELWLKEQHCRRIELCRNGDFYRRNEFIIQVPAIREDHYTSRQHKNKNSSRSSVSRYSRGS
jgi:hypothetical protein